MYTIHVLHCPEHPYPINMWLLYSSMTIVTLAKVSKLGGELEEERQLNKSLRENQEEWQVPKHFTSLSITPSLPCGHRHAWSELRLRWQCCSRKKTVRSLSYRNRLWGSPSLNVCDSFWNPGYRPWWSSSPPQSISCVTLFSFWPFKVRDLMFFMEAQSQVKESPLKDEIQGGR